jgi:hypothetical protein
VSVLVCGAILFAATTYDEGDAELMSKVAKQGIVNGLKVSRLYWLTRA